MRVGLRRLRAAISVFDSMLDGPETDAVKSELMWLTGELAPARELDVFLEQTLHPLRDAGGDRAALGALREDVASRRGIALERAKAAVLSDRYRQLVLRTGLWLIAMEWSDRCKLGVAQPSRRVRPLAHRALATRTKRAIRKLRRLSDLDAQQRHELRIQLKTIRYAAEFFDGVLPDCGLGDSEFLSTLKALLDDLGRLNEIAIQERLRDDFMASWDAVDAAEDLHTARKAFALGYVLGQQQQEKASLIAATKLARHRLARVSPF
jgi:CHAD domain-containing protein